ncbi:MAG: hypothetical protein LBR68_01370 [Lachnoclostridium sp.]|jgi:hypothetical protein|nr:hypothetical protein [Lachnoclostridium sp.]
MNIDDVKRIITSFADRPADLEVDKGQFLTEIRGEVIAAELKEKDEKLFIVENGKEESAKAWIRDRLAGLPLLADRILDYIPEDNYFVDPCGDFLDRPDRDNTGEEDIQSVESSIAKLTDSLPTDIPGISNVVYLTSDAGEGKTTLINKLARIQADKFKKKQSNWLLVPIPLGGRPFLRFDDVVVASLVNKLRFRYFYYDSFIELVKLGLIIPAFDGFEEMFMQNSAGEALTATGELINRLNSDGSILIAARKAYFDYKSFSTQAKLLDSIHGSVSFSKLAIKRWGKDQFIQYATNRRVNNPDGLYEIVSKGLNDANHPILTRPVLAKQLIDVVEDNGDVTSIISQLSSTVNYFPLFVHAIVEREANTKWIDTSGEPYKPILSIEQHYDLLAMLAEEMWLNSTEIIRDNVLDLLSELYCEQNYFSGQISRQVKERIKQHALIIKPNSEMPVYQFDHEEFFFFFLGILIADKIADNRLNDTRNLLRKGTLNEGTIASIVHRLKDKNIHISNVIQFLENCMTGESQFSYIKENASNITIKIISNEKNNNLLTLREYMFPMGAFLNIDIQNIVFEHCYIQNTSLMNTRMLNCIFKNCQFDRLEFDSTCTVDNVSLNNCIVSIVYDEKMDKGYYDSFSINSFLRSKGITLDESSSNTDCEITEDENLTLTEKALRRFIRSNTPINDDIFLMRLGKKGDYFIKNIVKDLTSRGILEELPYRGQGQKKRFKLGVMYNDVENALFKSKGKYQDFLNYFEGKKD